MWTLRRSRVYFSIHCISTPRLVCFEDLHIKLSTLPLKMTQEVLYPLCAGCFRQCCREKTISPCQHRKLCLQKTSTKHLPVCSDIRSAESFMGLGNSERSREKNWLLSLKYKQKMLQCKLIPSLEIKCLGDS